MKSNTKERTSPSVQKALPCSPSPPRKMTANWMSAQHLTEPYKSIKIPRRILTTTAFQKMSASLPKTTLSWANQYLWIAIPDLHDIADENDLSLDAATQIDLLNRQTGKKCATSIKQSHSPEKRASYIQTMKAIDLQFASLYQYIESHYEEEEFIVTMFGDHGQTYLLKPEDHHLVRHIFNVAFLMRDSHCKGTSTEYMAAVDYSHILCKLAEAVTFKSPDGQQLKAFGGDSQRAPPLPTMPTHPGKFPNA